MDNSKLILIVPSAFVLVLIILHSFKVHGARTSRNFFFWCFLFCFAKEFINAHARRPEYMGSGIEFLGVPMMVPIGWVISIYLSWFIAEAILHPVEKWRGAILPTIALSCVVIACISLCVECSGGNAGWWRWNYSIPGLWQENPILKMPVKIIGGWATTNLVFMSFFMLFEFSSFSKARNKALKIAFVLLILGSTVGIAATNLHLRQVLVAPLVVITITAFFVFGNRLRTNTKKTAPAIKPKQKNSNVEHSISLRGKERLKVIADNTRSTGNTKSDSN